MHFIPMEGSRCQEKKKLMIEKTRKKAGGTCLLPEWIQCRALVALWDSTVHLFPSRGRRSYEKMQIG